jgi:hypothetical protein
MIRKVQRKPKRYLQEKARQTAIMAPVRGLTIQEAVSILGGITGIIVAILWIAGRFYAAGYYSAMNIPSFQVNFSIWEYAEVSWLKLIFFFLRKIYPLLVSVAAIFFFVPLFASVLQRIFPTLKVFDLVRSLALQIKRAPSSMSYMLVFSIIVYFSYLLLLALVDINRTGQVEGKNVVFTSSYTVEVYSSFFLPLGTPNVMSNTDPTLLRYEGLRLLTFNNGKYYLFRDIDPVTCKPSQVFIIPESSDTHLVFSAVAPVEGPCVADSIPASVD